MKPTYSPDYKVMRQREYQKLGSLEDQFDVLVQGLPYNQLSGPGKALVDARNAIKAQHPKPTQPVIPTPPPPVDPKG
jgi:hypothetical protein